MNIKTVKAYEALKGHFTGNIVIFCFDGQRITKRDFREIKNYLDEYKR